MRNPPRIWMPNGQVLGPRFRTHPFPHPQMISEGCEYDFSYQLIIDADLEGLDLREADFFSSCLHEVDLRGRDLRGCDFTHADLRYADLRGADIRGAIFRFADLRYAKITPKYLEGADLWLEPDGLGEQANIAGAIINGLPVPSGKWIR